MSRFLLEFYLNKNPLNPNAADNIPRKISTAFLLSALIVTQRCLYFFASL
jgi:hypothetical protein